MRLLLYSTALILLLLPSCNLINPDEELPGYVVLTTPTLTTTGSQGTSSANITENWLFVNDNAVGIYSPGTSTPVLAEGTTRITSYGGIKNNGMASSRIRYPFYAPFDTVIDVQKLATINIQPKYTYVDGLNIDASRNFESLFTFVPATNNQGSFDVTVEDAEVKEGNGGGKITLGPTQSYFHFIDNSTFTFQVGSPCFLEMDYSCNNRFTVGCYAVDGSSTNKVGVLTLVPTTGSETTPTWNKIYLDFGALGLINASTDYYKIYFEGTRLDAVNPKIFLDNLKLVQFQN